jgi:hypothetical protein
MKITLRKLLYKAQWSWASFILYVLVWKNLPAGLRSIAFVALTGLLSAFLNKSFGISLWIGAPVIFLFLCIFAWAVLLGRLLLFIPFPPCKKGKCHSIDDYSWFMGSFFGKCKWGTYWYKCHCGDQYLRRGKRFMEFIPEVVVPPSPWININKGTTRPYKKLISFRKWADDTEPN